MCMIVINVAKNRKLAHAVASLPALFFSLGVLKSIQNSPTKTTHEHLQSKKEARTNSTFFHKSHVLQDSSSYSL